MLIRLQLWHPTWHSVLPSNCVVLLRHKYSVNHHLQSFVGGVVAYKALPRPQFSSLQQAIFPIYFSLQTALPVILALTYPGEKSGLNPAASGLGGCLAEKNRTNILVPIVTIFATSLANLLFIGPATTKVMKERKHQGHCLRTAKKSGY